MLRNFRSVLGTGRLCPALRNGTSWKRANELIPEIIKLYQHKMDSPPVGPVRLKKLRLQATTGMYYFMTLRVKGEDGILVSYECKAWLRVGNLGIKILSLQKVPGSERKSKAINNSEKKKIVKERLDVFKGLSLPAEMTTSGLDSGIVSGKLRTRGFCILVEQIRSQRSWTYSRVININILVIYAIFLNHCGISNFSLISGKEVCFYYMERVFGISDRIHVGMPINLRNPVAVEENMAITIFQ
ncbi:hypothetical protein KSS87_019344 [Heliosperma pusillum]|nr:hypothetical protein KSS87_019344 [Heliosperma pusillum]